MMTHHGIRLVLVAVTTGLVACIGTPSARTAPNTSGDTPAPANAQVLNVKELGTDDDSLLTVMERELPGLRVDNRGSCPAISLRYAPNSVPEYNNPEVYVDQARANDTCILEMLRAGDIERVELYPSGVTTRPGYVTAPHGLILVFSRSS